jgi:hypothetical protein
VFAIKVEIPSDDVKGVRKRRNEIYGSLTRERQIRVWRAVKDGRALSDPEEAAAAVRLARHLAKRRELPGWRRALAWVTGTMVVVSVVVQLVLLLHGENGSVPSWPTVVLAFYLLTHIYTWMSLPRRRETLLQSERLNVQVAESAGVPVETAESQGLTPERVHSRHVRGSDPWT